MKEQEIAGLLRDGATPTHLVHQGYARGTVYKVHKRPFWLRLAEKTIIP